MSTKAILIISWLDPDDRDYLAGVLAGFTGTERASIEYKFVGPGAGGRNAVRKEILDWNATDAEILFLLTHGNTKGLGFENAGRVTWQELWDWLQEAELKDIQLWLGAGESASCVDIFSHSVEEYGMNSPISVVIGFEDKPDVGEAIKLFEALIKPIIAFDNVGSSAGQALDKAKAVIPERKPVAFVHDATAKGYVFVKQQEVVADTDAKTENTEDNEAKTGGVQQFRNYRRSR